MSAQLPLFETDAEVAEQAWRDRFERADWTAQFDCGLGPAGTVISGWVCPACRMIEPTTFCLLINHGYDPNCEAASPHSDRFEECVSMVLWARRDAHIAARRAP